MGVILGYMAGGIPSQLKRFNDRLDLVEKQIAEELIPATRIASEKADAAIETASKALATATTKVSKKSDTRKR